VSRRCCHSFPNLALTFALGYNLCEQFAARGCKVFATARRIEAMSGLEGMNIADGILENESVD
jgi:NAD(P)-dependent dehydrogenase (short-subunit alcohol dehydrogenase family)